MKRYIRTKDGKITDTKECPFSYCEFGIIVEFDNKNILFSWKDIVNQANTIEELIEGGDLVRALDIITEVMQDNLNSRVIRTQCGEVGVNFITELYTKQGDDYILVATKENGKWRVL